MRKEERLQCHIQNLRDHIRECHKRIMTTISISFYVGKSIDNREQWTLDTLRTQVKTASLLNHRIYLEVDPNGDLRVKSHPNLPPFPGDLLREGGI